MSKIIASCTLLCRCVPFRREVFFGSCSHFYSLCVPLRKMAKASLRSALKPFFRPLWASPIVRPVGATSPIWAGRRQVRAASSDPARFGQLGFWEEYHQGTGQERCHHEWFLEADAALEPILPSLRAVCAHRSPGTDAVDVPTALHLGCGTSSLGVELSRHPTARAVGLQVTNLDFSPVAIEAMERAFSGETACRNTWVVADALNMPFAPACFDLVIDKGTYDAFECADAGHERKSSQIQQPLLTGELCQQVDRVLKRDVRATWLQITHAAPELRLETLNASLPTCSSASGSVWQLWSIGCQSLGEDDNGFEYFVYSVRRRPRFVLVRTGLHQADDVDVGEFVDEVEALATAAAYRAAGSIDNFSVQPRTSLSPKR
ncbi:unnamed protein product [Polarella glacialis]|uniref:Methyltransferase domain-containing protein n=1 Tax=Polarella glacialis TaxID=89957 RepID=A0A813DRS3_POLGL|nr:unnamed protein product [Polarella glacialis]